jgi:hypothetical protein
MTGADSAGHTVHISELCSAPNLRRVSPSQRGSVCPPYIYHPNPQAVHASFAERSEPKASIEQKGRESLLDLKVTVTMISHSFRSVPYEYIYDLRVCF